MSTDLTGRRTLVTGATGGIGMAITRALHARGASLAVTGRRLEQLDELRDELGDRIDPLPADLSSRDELDALVAKAGDVEILVANAALPASGSLGDFTAEQIDRALDVNLRAPIQLAHTLLPRMLERGFGRLVFISSMSGKVANAHGSIYSATKFGLRGFAFSLHQELKGTGVVVSTVFPGFIRDAGMFADSGVRLPPIVGTNTPEDVAAGVLKGIDSGRAEIDVAPVAIQVGSRLAGLAPSIIGSVSQRLGGDKIAQGLAQGQRDKR